MSTYAFIFLRANSNSCDDGDAVSGEELVRHVFLYLDLQFGLEFFIPILGSSASTDWGVSWWPDEDLADGCLPGRSTFQEHIDLFDVLLLPFVNFDASSYIQ